MPNNRNVYDKGKVIAGLLIFGALITFPFWYNLGKAAPAPELILTEKAKAAKVTATDQVLRVIDRSKKGVDTATLMKKTGFNQKKVMNILQRTFKQGKIKRVEKGSYVGVK